MGLNFVVVAYDVNEKRLPQVEKYLKGFLNHVQRSLFEGELTYSQIKRLVRGIEKIIDEGEDTVRIYVFESVEHVDIDCYGQCPDTLTVI